MKELTKSFRDFLNENLSGTINEMQSRVGGLRKGFVTEFKFEKIERVDPISVSGDADDNMIELFYMMSDGSTILIQGQNYGIDTDGVVAQKGDPNVTPVPVVISRSAPKTEPSEWEIESEYFFSTWLMRGTDFIASLLQTLFYPDMNIAKTKKPMRIDTSKIKMTR